MSKLTIDYVNFEKPEFSSRAPNGHMRTENLFLDTNPDTDKYKPVYTFREDEVEFEGEILPSAYQVILHSTSETDAAMRLLGSLRHWERLKQSPRIYEKGVPNKPVLTIKIALEDMEKRLKALAVDVLYEEAMNGNVTAAKEMANRGSEAKKSKPKSRKQEPGKPASVNNLFSNFKKD